MVIAIFHELANGKRSRRSRRKSYSRKTGSRKYRPSPTNSWVNQPLSAGRSRDARDFIRGRAYVTDGDGIRIRGQEVRIVGIDAPEWDQLAKHSDGKWFNHGKVVKSALIQEIGGEEVHVVVEDIDKFGRMIGTVLHDGRDIGYWLVREGHAIAAYDARYKRVEQEARLAKRGMWAHAHNFDPRAHRHRKPREG